MSGKTRRYLVILALALAAGARAEGGDLQYWNEFIFEAPLRERLDLETAFEQNWVDDANVFSLYNFTLEPSYRAGDRWSLGPGYRWEQELEEGEWLTENRYWLHLSLKGEAFGWKAKFKPLIEYRDLEGDDVWRFRPKLKIKRPLDLGSIQLTPYFAEDPFYVLEDGQWKQNRATAGFSFEPVEHLELSIYYMNVAKESDDGWYANHVIGTEIVFGF